MIEFLYQGLAADHGIVIITDNIVLLRQKLYLLRREAADSDLDCISLIPSPTNPAELWIVKK